MEIIINKSYLRSHPNEIFVFGDNLDRKGCGGAAKLRYEPNVYGFVTKKKPTHSDGDYYHPEEYQTKFKTELKKLIKEIENYPNKIFLISRLGGGLANKYNIFEKVIKPGLEVLKQYSNVKFLYE